MSFRILNIPPENQNHIYLQSVNNLLLLVFPVALNNLIFITHCRDVFRRLFGEPTEAGTCVKVSLTAWVMYSIRLLIK
jgi:hypothetical protein